MISDVVTYLTSLGTTGDEVAANLRILGVRGTRGAFTCPLARAVHRRFPETKRRDHFLMVGVDSVGAGPVGSVEYQPMPPGARAFFQGFQSEPCRYPDLWTGGRR